MVIRGWRPALGGLLRLAACAILPLALGACASDGGWTGVIGSIPSFDEGDQVVWSDGQERWKTSDDEPASLDAVSPELWTYAKGSIALRLKTSEDLNLYRGAPHALLLKVYQVGDPGALASELDSGLGLRRLLTSNEPDPAVLAVERIILQPGVDRLVTLDRALGARYLVFAAGFYDLDVATGTQVIPVPGVRDYPEGWMQLKPENWGATVNRFNPFGSPPPARPARLELWMELGAEKIEKLEVRAR